MMNLTPYEPLGTVSQLQNEINRLFRDWGHQESSGATANWVPSADINEFADRFELFVDLPGISADQVEITLENGTLSIVGERPMPDSIKGDEQPVRRRSERGYGRFHRRFILPETVDAEKVRATDRNGVLEVTIPKEAKAQPRRIPVAA